MESEKTCGTCDHYYRFRDVYEDDEEPYDYGFCTLEGVPFMRCISETDNCNHHKTHE